MELILSSASEITGSSPVQLRYIEAERCKHCQHQRFRLRNGLDAGNLALVSEILEAGVSPNTVFKEGDSSVVLPIEVAVMQGDFALTSLLLQHGASPNEDATYRAMSKGRSPLQYARFRNRIDIEILLRDYGAKSDVESPWYREEQLNGPGPLFVALLEMDLQAASRIISDRLDSPNQLVANLQPLQLMVGPSGNFDFVQALYEHLAPPHQRVTLKSVVRSIQSKHLLSNQESNFLHEHGSKFSYTLLNLMIIGGNFTAVHFLLKNGASVQVGADGLHPLHAAIEMDDSEIVQKLLDHGALIGKMNEAGLSDLHLACNSASADIPGILLKSGAAFVVRDAMGITPLLYACHYGHGAVVQLLLKAGASANLVNLTQKPPSTLLTGKEFEKYFQNSWSALCVAAYRGYTKIVNVLLLWGAHVSLRTKDGQTALDLAIASGHFDSVLLLLKANCSFVESSPQATTFLTKAIEGCQAELVGLLIERGVQYRNEIGGQGGLGEISSKTIPKIPPASSIRSLGLVRSSTSMSLLGGKIQFLSTSEKEKEKDNISPICTQCLIFFHRVAGLCTLPFPIGNKPDLDCKFCQLVSESISNTSDSESKVQVQFFTPTAQEGGRPYLEVFTGQETVKHTIMQVSDSWDFVLTQASKMENQNTDSPTATVIAAQWLDNCLSSHRQCNPDFTEPYFPTRVLDVLTTDPILREKLNATDPYVALSHRWSTIGLSTTTTANIEQRKHSIPLKSLSKTMQDAITITRNLGFRYLWVDALCIIQDSKEDWQQEASTMRDVYRRATLTIAAAAADDHSQGIFSPRQSACVHPIRFEDFLMPRTARSHFDGDGYIYIFPSTSKSSNGIRPKGALDQRKWILQEQLLSPRILYYGKGELFWDCLTVSASESSPISASLPADGESAETWATKVMRRALAEAGTSHLQVKHLQEAWLQVTINYSRRKSTKHSDNLIAIEGVMEGLKDILHAKPLAGMWDLGLWRQLTWWIETAPSPSQATSNNLVEDPEDDTFQAPTWSWLNIRDPISYHNTIRGKSLSFEDLKSSVEILHYEIEENKSRSHISGKLTLKAHIFPYHLTQKDMKNPEMKIWQRWKGNKGRWLLDRPLFGVGVGGVNGVDVRCVVLARDEMVQVLVCLVVIAVEDGERDGEECFRRVGLCHWDGGLEMVGRDNGGRRGDLGVITIV